MLKDRPRVDHKMLHSTGEGKLKSKSNEELSQSYSLSSLSLPSNQAKSLSNISISVTEHLLSSSFISSPSLTSTDNHQSSTHLRVSNPEKMTSSIYHRDTSKADNLIVTELSTLFNNCFIQELKSNDDKSAVIQQVSAQITTISYDIDEFIDKTFIEEISSSFHQSQRLWNPV